MSLKDNFNIKSWRLIPYWVCVFIMPAAIALTIVSFTLRGIPSPTIIVLTTLLSVFLVYYTMKKNPIFARKALIVMAVLFTSGVAYEFAKATYITGGILPAAIVPIPIFLLSYVVNRYALRPRMVSANQRPIFFFF